MTVALMLVVVPSIVLRSSVADAEPLALVDTFSRNDDWRIGATETGQPWQLWSGTAVVRDGAGAASVDGYTLAVADAGHGVGTLSLTVTVVSSEFWLVFRGVNNGNYWRFGRWNDGAYQLQQVSGWTLGTPVVTQHATVQAAAGDVLACLLGPTVTCSVNGAIVASSEEDGGADAHMVGFAMAASGVAPATRIDDVRFEPAPPAADLAVDVVAGAPSVGSGAVVEWTVTVHNLGDAPALDVAALLSLPAGLSDVQLDGGTALCSPGPEVACNLGELAPGSNAVVSVSGVAPVGSGVLALAASAVGAAVDPHPLNDHATAAVSVEAPIPANAVVVDNFDRADSYSMAAAPTGQVWQVWNGTARVAGQRALSSEPGYMLAVVDAATGSGSVSVTVPVISPEFWLVARGSNSGNYWRFGSASGGAYELQLVQGWALASAPLVRYNTVLPAAGDRLSCRFVIGITCAVNGVDVVGSSQNFNPTAGFVGIAAGGPTAPAVRFDDFRAATATLGGDLTVDIAAVDRSVLAGATAQWTATVRNTGAEAVDAVTMLADAAPSLSGLAGAGPGGPCVVAGLGGTCPLGRLEPGQSASVTFAATTPLSLGSYGLTVSVGPTDADTDRSDNTDTAAVSVRMLAVPGEEFSDHFDRTDAVELGAAEGGRLWEQWAGRIGVAEGQAGRTDAGPVASLAVIDPGFGFGTLDVSLVSGSQERFAIVFRARDPQNLYLLGPDYSGHYRVQKLIDGRITDLQFGAVRANVAPADGDRIRLVLRPDDSFFVTVNGEHILDGGDLALIDEFRFGFQAASPLVRFDDLHISQTMSSGLVTHESFSGPSGSNLELRAPSSGTRYVWLTPRGYWTSRDGRGALESPGYGVARLETSSQLATVRLQVVDGDEGWLVFRHGEDGSYHRFGFGPGTGNRYVLQRVTGSGPLGALPTQPVVVDTAAADGDVIEVRQAVDGAIQGYVNGVLVLQAVDAINNVGATAYGMAGVGLVVDDVVITPH